MTDEIFLIADLMVKRLRGDLDERDGLVLDEWLSKDGNRALWEKLSNENELNDRLARMYDIDSEAAKRKAYEQLFPGVIPMGERKQAGWKRWMAAASVLVVVMGVLWAAGVFSPAGKNANRATATNELLKDIAPANGNVVLTLADGRRLLLDSMKSGESLLQGNASVVKSGGAISYGLSEGNALGQPVINTLETAKGKQYLVELSDGTKVFLNAASSIRFPSSFAGKERRVTITGEAYLEVAKNLDKPFIVTAGETEVEVLGTKFNVMAYENELTVNTTLIEGSVRVRGRNDQQLLRPGEQAAVGNAGQITILSQADTVEALAWKNREFHFSGTTLDAIMRQVERWYDVEVVFESDIQEPFVATISMDVPLSKLLKVLELTDLARFHIDGRRIIVKPYYN